MERTEISKKVVEILATKLLVGVEECIEEAELAGDLGADSFDLVEVLMQCESDFHISIPDEEFDDVFTVGAVIDLIEKKVKKDGK